MISRSRQVRGFFRVDLLDTVRYWYASMLSVMLTVFYYLMLGSLVPPEQLHEVTRGFVVLAAFGVTLFQFSTRSALERLHPWTSYLRTLPAPLWTRFAGRFLVVLLIAPISALAIVAASRIKFGLDYDGATLTTVLIAVVMASVIFAPIGACVGGLLHPRTLPSIATVCYIAMAWAGGLWSAGRSPASLGHLPQFLPLDVAQDMATTLTAGDLSGILRSSTIAAAWIGGALLIAAVVYARDEGEQFT